MSDSDKKITRKNGRHLRVPVLPDEEIEIKNNAATSGLTTAEYLRRLGLGLKIHGIIDKQHILELSKINADLGRLGGLLKLWLTNDERLAHFNFRTITSLLNRIRSTQDALLEVVKKL
ncbi:conjugal transfer relaxosome component TraJ [Legionella nautarum]|uniref:Conjugal transfer relaxosome component TraJ n=1 Tax=Legionella nautarum TaxID=45070 RepID=A0A0W0WNC1_9GAMM|nr:conjugal transfer transcriptional regulator TraJ [Legionella nautarum]KTD33840.1 conjugal transfer relaxosome component TraJ [Legionella nautarum]